MDPTTSTLGDNVVKVTAGLIAAVPFFAEIDHLRESQRQDLRMRIKYPDQVVHLVVPRLRDLKRIVSTDDVKATGMIFVSSVEMFQYFAIITAIICSILIHRILSVFVFQAIIGVFEQTYCYRTSHGPNHHRLIFRWCCRYDPAMSLNYANQLKLCLQRNQ